MPLQVINALKGAAVSSVLDIPVNATQASSSNPGIPPPSSLYSLLRVKPSVAAVAIQEYDRCAKVKDPWICMQRL
jgi:hypothetical protein